MHHTWTYYTHYVTTGDGFQSCLWKSCMLVAKLWEIRKCAETLSISLCNDPFANPLGGRRKTVAYSLVLSREEFEWMQSKISIAAVEPMYWWLWREMWGRRSDGSLWLMEGSGSWFIMLFSSHGYFSCSFPSTDPLIAQAKTWAKTLQPSTVPFGPSSADQTSSSSLEGEEGGGVNLDYLGTLPFSGDDLMSHMTVLHPIRVKCWLGDMVVDRSWLFLKNMGAVHHHPHHSCR